MQNLPLLNTQNAAIKPPANAQKPLNTVEVGPEHGGFQQKLMQQIHQKQTDKPSNQTLARADAKTTSADTTQNRETKPATETSGRADAQTTAAETPAGNDIISRKIKGLLGKTNAADSKQLDAEQALLAQDKTAQDNTATGQAETSDTSLDPASINVLAQIQHNAQQHAPIGAQTSAGNSADRAANKPLLLDDANITEETADTNGLDLSMDKTTQDKAGLGTANSADKTGMDKSLMDKALAAANSAKSAEDFDAKLSDKLSQSSAIKETSGVMQAANTMQQVTQTAASQLANNGMIMAHPGKEGWNQAIGQRVLWMVGAAQQSATLTLNPPEMGPLQIVINVHNDKADTTFYSDRQEVRQALQDGMDNLREMMKEAGINLGQANINQRDKATQEFMAPPSGKQATNNENGETDASANSADVTTSRTALGLVDTFA